MKRLISKLLPVSLKQKIRQTDIYSNISANHLAATSKRIDICAAQFASLFHLSNQPSIEGKTCLEIGSGWVLSHAVVCYLLGAKRIIATDIFPSARPSTLAKAIKGSITYIPRDVLAAFSDYSKIRERYNKLLTISTFNFKTLKKELGIEYLSPVDLAAEPFTENVDFIYSLSVLEHVPKQDVQALLHNLSNCLNVGGTMIHCIHLEDHRDIFDRPFDFLDIPEKQFSRLQQTDRGNRIRYSQWKNIFESLKGTKTEILYNYQRTDTPLPELIDPSVLFKNENDLRTSHVGVYLRKVS